MPTLRATFQSTYIIVRVKGITIKKYGIVPKQGNLIIKEIKKETNPI